MRKLFIFLCFFTGISANLSAQYGDCNKAKEICKKEQWHIKAPKGEGSDNREADFMHCFMNGDNFGQAEENSTWIKFEIKESGTLSFTITPDEATDDIDFVVFRGDCNHKEVVRCMASGARGNEENASPCMGKTGLRTGELDSSEDAGCQDPGDNAWLAPLKTIKGEKYIILVSNVTGPRGWSINLGGTAKLPCENPPKKDKPKDKPKESPPPPKKPDIAKAPPTPTPPPPPQEINGRAVEVGETVKIKNRKIKLKIWDSQIEDGDIISVFLGDKKILDHYRLRTQPQEFEFELPQGVKEHYLTVYADDFGKSEPNTASIIIYDGVKEQRIDLVAGRKKQESVKIMMSDE